MDNKMIPCIRCDYALGLIKQKGMEEIARTLIAIGGAIEAETEIAHADLQSIMETVVYLIQHLGYGSTPPRAVVSALAQSMSQSAAKSHLLLGVCGELEQKIRELYP